MRSRTTQLARDPTAHIECHEVDDRFVPLRFSDLTAALRDVCATTPELREAWAELVAALSSVIEAEEAGFENEVLDAYSFFNPDRDTLPLASDEAARTPEGYDRVKRLLLYILDKANFEPLDGVLLDHVAEMASERGLRVRLDPTLIDHLEIHVRGRGETLRRRKSYRHPIEGETVTLPVYRRLAVVARLKGDPHVLIKMFKDIPEEDVEALLPHAQVTMNWTDRLFMLSGGVGAVGSTAMKIVSASLLVLSRLLWVVLVGAGVLIYRTFTGYRFARQQRDSQRTRHLYYQNVSNNAGALQVLIAMISQEDVKEILLAYALCAASPRPPENEADLKHAVEDWILRRFEARVDFDVEDAIGNLDRLRLWDDRSRLRVLGLKEAAIRLRRHWSSGASATYHRDKWRAGRA